MEEILTISDEVTIMRDGQYVGTWPASELTTDLIINRMVGRDLTHRFPPKENKPGEVIMQVRNLTAKYQPSIKDVSFELRKGEILGVAGLMGARRTELLENIFGIAHHSEGEIFLHGKKVENKDSATAIKNGGEHGADHFDPLHVHPQPETGNWYSAGGGYRQACCDPSVRTGNHADCNRGLPAGLSVQ